MKWSTIVTVLSLFIGVQCYVKIEPDMRSFSSVIKEGTITAEQEKVLYERNTGQPGVITEQWSAGWPETSGPMGYDTRIRIYTDGETTPSLDFQLFLAHGIGFNASQEPLYVPWGTRRVGHLAVGGGLYNTFRIPYSSSIKITATSPYSGLIWYIVKGVENYPVVLGDLQLPPNVRLMLYKNVSFSLPALEFLSMANISGASGAVFLVTVAANNSAPEYLEACFRAVIDDGPVSFLSSGTEDFFLSAYYFEKGPYHGENSGLTYENGIMSVISAYRFFENAPVLFSKSLQLLWRSGETADGDNGCPSDFPPPSTTAKHKPGMPGPPSTPTVVTSYTWVYQW